MFIRQKIFLERRRYQVITLGPRNSPKANAKFAYELLHLNDSKMGLGTSNNLVKMIQLKEVLKRSMELKQNLIFSAEDLSQISIDAMKLLYDAFHDFNSTIVIVFRDSLVRALSSYRQLCSSNPTLRTIPGFHDFRSFINQTSQVKGYYSSIIQRYASIFGLSNIMIIDYYGTIASQKDIAYALLCQIDSKLCISSEFFSSGSIENSFKEHYSLIVSGLFNEVYLTSRQRNCTVRIPSHKNILGILQEMIEAQNNVNDVQMIPSYRIHLKDLHDMSIAIDDEIRREYASNIINSDRQASIDAIESLTVDELDVHVFRSSKYWQDWMNTCMSSLADLRLITCPTSDVSSKTSNRLKVWYYLHIIHLYKCIIIGYAM